MPRFAAFLALLLTAVPLFAQETPQTPFGERVDVNVVLVDAVVTDNKGNQILGLEKDDFIVKENGVVKEIETVDYFTNRKLLNAQEQNVPFKVERVREDRYFVLFFDKPGPSLLYERVKLARDAARKFVREEMKPGDLVAVVGHDVRLKVYSDFTADKGQLEQALEDVARFGRGITTAPKGPATAVPSILRTIGIRKMIDKTGTVYEALDVLADSLRPIRARKNLILFSPGILEPGESVQNGMVVSPSRHFQPMIQSLNAANVVAYTANLQLNPPETPAIHQSLQRIALETNGEYIRNSVSYAPVLEKVEKSASGYYLLSYRSRHATGAKGYQKLDVSLRNPEFKVRAREGYEYGE